MLDFQLCVVEEKKELDEKRISLQLQDQAILKEQLAVMYCYSSILEQRIAAFK